MEGVVNATIEYVKTTEELIVLQRERCVLCSK